MGKGIERCFLVGERVEKVASSKRGDGGEQQRHGANDAPGDEMIYEHLYREEERERVGRVECKQTWVGDPGLLFWLCDRRARANSPQGRIREEEEEWTVEIEMRGIQSWSTAWSGGRGRRWEENRGAGGWSGDSERTKWNEQTGVEERSNNWFSGAKAGTYRRRL